MIDICRYCLDDKPCRVNTCCIYLHRFVRLWKAVLSPENVPVLSATVVDLHYSTRLHVVLPRLAPMTGWSVFLVKCVHLCNMWKTIFPRSRNGWDWRGEERGGRLQETAQLSSHSGKCQRPQGQEHYDCVWHLTQWRNPTVLVCCGACLGSFGKYIHQTKASINWTFSWFPASLVLKQQPTFPAAPWLAATSSQVWLLLRSFLCGVCISSCVHMGSLHVLLPTSTTSIWV